MHVRAMDDSEVFYKHLKKKFKQIGPVVHSTIFWWKRRFLYEFQGFNLSKNEKKIEFLKIERWAAPLNYLYFLNIVKSQWL